MLRSNVWAFPQMRQDVRARVATRTLPGSVLVCIALMSGAIFGMAAQTALQHFALDLGSVRSDLIVDRVAHPRSALAWWAWWIVPVVAFFVGPFSVALARILVANWLSHTAKNGPKRAFR